MAVASTPRGRPARALGLPSRYGAIRRIARGGMSTLWRAEDTVLGRSVAIKLLAGSLADDPNARRRFEREARAAASLSHPHVVTIFDVGETTDGHGQPYIVMEHLDGGTVGEALNAGRIERGRALRWIAETAAALDFAHRRGVVHRDVKPANLLLNQRDAVKVADFGIARLTSEATITATGQLFGTAAYLSPEQAQGEPATAASDRYALAVVAYELLAGRRPFTGEGFAAQAHGHLELDPPPASVADPALPRGLDGVLGRGLAKAPADRWDSCAAFAAAVSQACATAPEPDPAPATVPLRPQRPAAALPPPVRPRRPQRMAAAAALFGALVLAAVIVLLAHGAGHSARSVSAAAPSRARPTARRPSTAPRSAARSPRPANTGAAVAQPASSPATAAAAPAGTSADALEAQGHALLAAGSPAAAVPVLQRAVAAATPGTLTRAYALYDLGHALRLSGNPAAAIPILQQRLQIPNQTAVVRQELALAMAAAGQSGPRPAAPAAPVPAPNPGNGKAKGKDKGPGHGGGD